MGNTHVSRFRLFVLAVESLNRARWVSLKELDNKQTH